MNGIPDENKNVHFRERFGTCFNAWKAQVDSYWQRSSYFAVFETAAVAGTWKIIESRHWITSLFASILGLILTRTWYLNNSRMHEYVKYWWERIADIEIAWGLDADSQIVSHYEERRVKKEEKGNYSEWIQRIPKLFALIWGYLLVLSGILLSHFIYCVSRHFNELLSSFR